MGRMTVIPGTAAVTITGAPKITMTDWERQVANLPGLRHVIDPAKLDSDGNGRDRFSGAMISSKDPAVANKVAADAGFNNLPVIELSANTGGLNLAPGTVTPSCSFLCVASRSGAGTRGLLNVFNTAGVFKQSFRLSSGNNLLLLPDNADPTVNSIIGSTPGNIPATGAAGVWGFSYDAETMQSAVLWQGANALNLVTHTLNPVLTDDCRWSYGGSTGNLGWIGKLGIGLIFDRAMHLPTTLPFFQLGVSLLREKYALS